MADQNHTGEMEVVEVREAHRFDEAVLTAYLSDNMDGFEGPIELRQFAGGQSNPTFVMSAASGEYVLRKQPPGELLPSAHRVDREYRVMSGLKGTGVPVPVMHHLCRDKEIIGTDFFVMEKIEGRVFHDPRLPGLDPAQRTAIYDQFIDTLAEMHMVDLAAQGLEEYGRPGNYFARQIDRWSQQYVASKTEEIPAMDSLMAWLAENVPESEEASIVHGDYRMGNCIIHPAEPKILAVLDWELSTLGHPFADVAYTCMGYHGDLIEDNFSGMDLAALGLPDEEYFLNRYSARTKRGKIENWEFYVAFGGFRSAAIIQGVYKRGLEGIASSAGTERFAGKCASRAASAWVLIKVYV